MNPAGQFMETLYDHIDKKMVQVKDITPVPEIIYYSDLHKMTQEEIEYLKSRLANRVLDWTDNIVLGRWEIK